MSKTTSIDASLLLRETLDALFAKRAVPRSTYRVQFHKNFTFRDAAAIVPYLRQLGVSHLYASPYTKATPGSTHGYDVVDHQTLNPELGTEADYDALVNALSVAGMGQILDIVPNHQGVATNENRWWNDVLKHGPASRFAGHFDINWNTLPPAPGHPRVLLPLLGRSFGEALEAGELKLVYENGDYFIAYFDRRFPVSPSSATDLALSKAGVDSFAGTPGDAASFDRLEELLDAQHYRLAYWRVGPEEINYRRFFDVNDLAALAMEEQRTFDDAHTLILDLVASGKVAGLRVDHPDGLRDPGHYFRRLQWGYVMTTVRRTLAADGVEADEAATVCKAIAAELDTLTNDDGIDGRGWPLYVVAEKILAPAEGLPASWAVDGTSGYDFLNEAAGLFVDSRNANHFSHTYRAFTDESDDVEAGVYQAKRFMLHFSFATELNQLAHLLRHVARADRMGRDYSLATLSAAAVELIACFPVYRSYLGTDTASDVDMSYLAHAAVLAEEHAPPAVKEAVHYIHALLLEDPASFDSDDVRAHHAKAVARFQQLTAPVTAKGVEDTFFYRYQRLIALNEVGSEPGAFGLPPEDVHAYLTDRQEHWPNALSVMATHDTKRSADLRARLYAVTEMPAEWTAAVETWRASNASLKTDVAGEAAPSAGDEYLFYQSLVGAWPTDGAAWDAFRNRMEAFMIKALREAKTHTNWTDPDTAYEDATKQFVADVLDRSKSAAFFEAFEPFVKRVAHVGVFTSLAQTLLRLAAPGVPDTYQGTELFDFSLVDPDNRRPVDYDARRCLLNELKAMSNEQARLAGLLASPGDGRTKLLLTARVLACREARPALFAQGQYVPLEVTGDRAEHTFAFARVTAGEAAVCVIPRLLGGLLAATGVLAPVGEAAWGDTAVVLPTSLSGKSWRGVIDDASHGPATALKLADLLRDFPGGLVVSV